MATIIDRNDIIFSSQGRSGTPDGNVYLDVSDPVNPVFEVLASDEISQLDYGSGLEANRLSPSGGSLGGLTFKALYGAITVYRGANETIRRFAKIAVGKFSLAGAYDLLNNWQPSTDADLKLLRGSGLRFLSVTGQVNRIYFGAKSLGEINSASQPYFQTSALGSSTDFTFQGDVDEMIQVFGTTANGDTSAGNFDNRSFFSLSVRSWGRIHDRKVLGDSGFESAENFLGGFGLTEPAHPTTGSYNEADVSPDGSPVAPWSTMAYKTETSPVLRSGFNEADGNFSESIENPAGGSLDEVVAFMDALSRSPNDIDGGTPSQIGKDTDTLYYFDQGIIVLKQGLFIENLPSSELTRVRLTDDAGNVKTFPTLITVSVATSAPAQSDANAWYHAFIEDDEDTSNDYNSINALTAKDKDGVDIKGLVSGAASIQFDLNFNAAPIGTTWEAGEAYQIRFIVGGDPSSAGGPVENFVIISIDGTTQSVNAELSNEVENNV